MQDLDALTSDILSAVAAAGSPDALEAVRIDTLGKKGRVSLMMRELG
ncbi:MAG: phenylalanine--tRNA ligase subunit alpha, partial [Pseudomonadota bacterium]|nr:phenylalanine--tRNA ligase subunit alpha [Pseudomonadota bacterium]